MLPADFLASVRCRGFYHVKLDQASISSEFMMQHISYLKQWAPEIIRAHPEHLAVLERHVESFTRIAVGLSGSRSIGWSDIRGTSLACRSIVLLFFDN